PLPQSAPKSARACFISPDQPIEAVLGLGKPLIGTAISGPEYRTNATVWISDHKDSTSLSLHPSQTYYVEAVPHLAIVPGRTYYLWASVPGLPPVSASCKVPSGKVADMSASRSDSPRGVDSVFAVTLSWTDLPNEDNYYRIFSEQIDSLNN